MARKVTGLSGVPIGNARGGVTHEVSCRPIDNGFIVRESTYDGDDYRSNEKFSKTAVVAPKIITNQTGSVGDERLAGAIRECKS
jgi:hypothetical protein